MQTLHSRQLFPGETRPVCSIKVNQLNALSNMCPWHIACPLLTPPSQWRSPLCDHLPGHPKEFR